MQHAWATAPSYFKEIRRFPMLNAEEEQVLVARWREVGDGGCAQTLDQPPAVRGQDRERLPWIWLSDLRSNLGGQQAVSSVQSRD